MVEALPKSCESVELRWTPIYWRASWGRAAGLGAYPHIKRLSLEGFRCTEHLRCYCMPLAPCSVPACALELGVLIRIHCCHTLVNRVTELPPSVAHLTLKECILAGVQLPAARQLCSLSLMAIDDGDDDDLDDNSDDDRGATPKRFLDLLEWLERAQPQATVRVSHARLTLGTLSMERYARRLVALAPRSTALTGCTLYSGDGRRSAHSVAEVARYVGRQYSRRFAVTCLDAGRPYIPRPYPQVNPYDLYQFERVGGGA